MVERQSPDSFSDRLIAQDKGISTDSLKEQFMSIQQVLASLDEKARACQRLTIRAIASVIVCYLIGFAFNAAQSWGVAANPVLATIWMLCTWAALITAAVAATRYWTVHRPRLEKGRSDLQVAMFQELQRQIAELRLENKS
jgi:uncharacterized membrane protein